VTVKSIATTSLVLVLLAVAAGTAAAAETVLSGSIQDASTRSPLSYAIIHLEGAGVEAISDRDGNFVVGIPNPGTYRLIVSRIGYLNRIDTVTVTAGEKKEITVLLEPTMFETEEIVVTATRKEQTARLAPATVNVLTAEQLQRKPVQTFDQALETLPGVTGFRSNGIAVQAMSIRGSSDVAGGGVGNRVLLLIDGRPALTSDSGGAFWSLVPISFIGRTEVVKGAFSSLYGSTAMGGVVNVITTRPSNTAKLRLNFQIGFFEQSPAGIKYTEETRLQSLVDASYSSARGRVSYLLSGSYKQSDGHTQRTAFELFDLYGRLLFDLGQNRNLELTVGGGNAQSDYPHSWLNSDEPLRVRDKYTDDRQEKRQFNADLWYWAVTAADRKYSSRFYYYQHNNRSYFNENDTTKTLPGNEELDTRVSVDGQKIGHISQVDFYFSDRSTLIAGADIQIDVVKSAPDTVMYGDQQINNFALYAQDETDITSRLSLTVGGRYDWNHLVGHDTHGQFSPKLGMVWRTTNALALRALYGRAYRAPTIAELFFQKELSGGIDFVPNPDLGPEKMTLSVEAGVNVSPHPVFELDVAVFRYEYENLIYWISVSEELGVNYPVFQVRNLNSALIQGTEITVRSRWGSHVDLRAGYTWLDARDQSEDRTDDVLAYRPEHNFNASAGLYWRRTQLHVQTRYRSEIEEVFLYPLQAPDAFWVTDAKAQYRLFTSLSLTATVNNMFDVQYEELARYRMPGRHWLFGLSFDM
jgi:outer membrane receptor for ferrienterochelin and colicins